MLRKGFSALFALTISLGMAAPPPAMDFLTEPDVADFKLSPDGTKVAFLRRTPAGSELCVYDVAGKATTPVSEIAKRHRFAGFPAGSAWFYWAPPKRLIVANNLEGETGNRRLSVGPDFSRGRRFPGNFALGDYSSIGLVVVDCESGEWFELPVSVRQQPYFGQRATGLTFELDRAVFPPSAPGFAFVPGSRDLSDRATDLYRLDLRKKDWSLVQKVPGGSERWFLDSEGAPKLAAKQGETGTKLMRPDAAGKWQEWALVGSMTETPLLHDLAANGRSLVATHRGGGGRMELAEFDLETRRWSEALLSDPRYDVGGGALPSYADEKLSVPVFSPIGRRLLGVRYVGQSVRQHWFDPKLAALQRSVDVALPVTCNLVTSVSEAGDKAVVLSWSGQDPGFYSLVETATTNITLLARRMGWIKPEEMGVSSPFRCRGRDGTELDGYLTFPPGSDGKNLPLVVLLRERLVRRDIWGFNPLAQLLATRGLAVLQVNHRGLTGYGTAFSSQGRDATTGVLHHDIDDAVRWATSAGVADPRRVAIMGENFGGFAALYALGNSPELYHCGVAISAISDLVEVAGDKRAFSHVMWVNEMEYIRDGMSEALLKSRSPVYFADRIKAPLLVVHNGRDQSVPIEQSMKLVSALKKVGAPPQTLYYDSETSENTVGPGNERIAAAVCDKIAAFLTEQLAPKPVPATK